MGNFKNKLNNLEISLTYDDVLIKPRMSTILPAEVDISVKLSDTLKIDVPILSAAMDTVTEYEMAKTIIQLGGIAPLHKNLEFDYVISSIKKLKNEFGENKPYAVAIGVDNTKKQIQDLINVGVNVLVIDSAHGHSKNIGDLVEHVSITHPHVFLIAGNVVTKEGAQYLIDKGANCIKVGIGPGSTCITRKITGVGIGQLSAIANVSEICKKNSVFTIADGGIKTPDEIMKALVAGADMVMLGYMLAGTHECPGKSVIIDNQEYKLYRGMGCINAMKSGSASRYNKKNLSSSKWIAEGIESYVRTKGSVENIMHTIVWGLKSAFGYVGSKNIKEVHANAEFVRITKSVLKKSDAHSIDKVIEVKK